MAAPNLISLTTVNVDTLHFDATGSAATVTGSTVATNHARKVEAILATNVGATLGWISVWRRTGGVDKQLAYELRVPLRTTVNVLIGAPLYMTEGDTLKVQANASNNVHISAPYADMV
jgi:hypothetical protein